VFVDQVAVKVQAGRGGDGCVSFRREYKVPRGGPDGGHGGHGGSVVFLSDASVHSLAYFRFHPLLRAKNGAPGEGGHRTGARGADLKLSVPVGTVVKNGGTDEDLFDFVRAGQAFTAAKGGKGGRGNASYATSTHQSPREWEPGRPGEERELALELKLIADVGLVGYPNAGKSTLISRISAARPLIADYPFTTLTPTLGVVDTGPARSFVVADIPGLIEGAHLGQGLGIRFLRHVERTKVLVHIVDVSPYTERDPVHDYGVVMKELESFDPGLARRTMILAANKIDLLGRNRSRLNGLKRLAGRKKMPFFPISALKGDGLRALVRSMAETLEHLEKEGQAGAGGTA
jgi:GTP-binding protein